MRLVGQFHLILVVSRQLLLKLNCIISYLKTGFRTKIGAWWATKYRLVGVYNWAYMCNNIQYDLHLRKYNRNNLTLCCMVSVMGCVSRHQIYNCKVTEITAYTYDVFRPPESEASSHLRGKGHNVRVSTSLGNKTVGA